VRNEILRFAQDDRREWLIHGEGVVLRRPALSEGRANHTPKNLDPGRICARPAKYEILRFAQDDKRGWWSYSCRRG
jgi:hypothetical protein